MKQWLPAMLLPLILLQAPVLAQTESAPEVNEQKPVPAVVTPITKPDPAIQIFPFIVLGPLELRGEMEFGEVTQAAIACNLFAYLSCDQKKIV